MCIRDSTPHSRQVAAQMLSPAQAAPKTALQARRFRRPLARTTAAMLHTT